MHAPPGQGTAAVCLMVLWMRGHQAVAFGEQRTVVALPLGAGEFRQEAAVVGGLCFHLVG